MDRKRNQLSGRVVLLDFWSISCVPCVTALPHTEALYNEFKNKGLVVIGVCAGWGSEKAAMRILKKQGITFPNLIDQDLAIADEKDGYTTASYALDAYPSYALIDKLGRLAWKSSGGIMPSESQIRELLEP